MLNGMRSFGCRIYKDIKINGVRSVIMENEKVRIVILAEKGSDIAEFLYKPLDIDFMWHSPIGIRSLYPSSISSKRGNFFDYYEGGWQEIFPAGSGGCSYKGAEFGIHGETSMLPWDFQIIKDCVDEISVKFTTTTVRTPFRIEKILTMKSNDPSLYIDETVYNDSYEDLDVMWGHHPAFGYPFLDESCEIYAPAKYIKTLSGEPGENAFLKTGQKSLWPICEGINEEKIDVSKVLPMESKKEGMAFLFELEKGEYRVYNRNKSLGFGMEWDIDVMPYLWFWMVYGGSFGFPWYGNAYTIALEPWTSMVDSGKEGLLESIRMGNSLKIKAHGTKDFRLKAFIFN